MGLSCLSLIHSSILWFYLIYSSLSCGYIHTHTYIYMYVYVRIYIHISWTISFCYILYFSRICVWSWDMKNVLWFDFWDMNTSYDNTKSSWNYWTLPFMYNITTYNIDIVCVDIIMYHKSSMTMSNCSMLLWTVK